MHDIECKWTCYFLFVVIRYADSSDVPRIDHNGTIGPNAFYLSLANCLFIGLLYLIVYAQAKPYSKFIFQISS